MKKNRMQHLLQYVFPAIVGQVAFFLFTIVDGIFIGRGVGGNAIGAINIVNPFIMIVNALYLLITIGGSAIVAVRHGRGDNEGANHAFMHSFVLMIGLGIVLTIIGTVFTTPVGRLLGANDVYIGYVTDYLFWYSAFIIPSSLAILFQFFCRNDGSPNLVMIAMIASSALNVFLDWLFVFPMQKGVAGAAIATGISQTFSFLILATHFVFHKGELRICRFKWEKVLLGKIFIRGIPETLAQFATSMATLWMNIVLIHKLGEMAVNVFGVIGYMVSFATAIFLGISEGAQPLFGQSYGEKNDSDLHFYFRSSCLIGVIGSAVVYVALLLTSSLFSRLFVSDQAIIDYVVKVIPAYASGFLIIPLNTLISTYLYSTKRTTQAIVLNTLRSFVFTTASILILPNVLGTSVIWFTFVIYEALSLIVGIILIKTSEKNGVVYR